MGQLHRISVELKKRPRLLPVADSVTHPCQRCCRLTRQLEEEAEVGGAGWRAKRREVAEANIGNVGTIKVGGDALSQCCWPTD
jgi:hypothetical protein